MRSRSIVSSSQRPTRSSPASATKCGKPSMYLYSPGFSRLPQITSMARFSPRSMACQCYPGGHCGAGQGGGFLERQVAWQKHDRFFIEDRVFRQHSVEIGAEPVGQVVGLDRSAKPARMKATRNPVANLDPRHSFANCCD